MDAVDVFTDLLPNLVVEDAGVGSLKRQHCLARHPYLCIFPHAKGHANDITSKRSVRMILINVWTGLDFDSFSNIWFHDSTDIFACREVLGPSELPMGNISRGLSRVLLTEIDPLIDPLGNEPLDNKISFFDMWCKIIIVCLLQSIGTVIGGK